MVQVSRSSVQFKACSQWVFSDHELSSPLFRLAGGLDADPDKITVEETIVLLN